MSSPINRFQFGNQTITTRVFTMVPRTLKDRQPWVDVTAAMDDHPFDRAVMLRMLPPDVAATTVSSDAVDPFGGVAV
jgi:hypothetical protein